MSVKPVITDLDFFQVEVSKLIHGESFEGSVEEGNRV